VDYLHERTGIDFRICDFRAPNWLCVTARSPEGEVLGVLVAEFQVWFEAHVTWAIDDPRFMTRRLLRAVFSTLFSRAVRITAMSRPDNEKSIQVIRHLGFTYEGYLRLGIEGKWDGMIFGMLRNECRWIRAPKEALYEIAKAA
jgi:RimJ/RimL family protein N-acetyltransferase